MKKAIATRARTQEILEKFELSAKKGYGQNFIIEPAIVEKIAEYAQCEDSCVIEIGPGIGALTEQLSKRAKKVIAYEIDERLLEVLNDTLSEYDNVEIIHQDFLKVDLGKEVQRLQKKFGEVVICANLPYYITAPLLFKIFEAEADIKVITVMMQKEVGDRFCAKPSTKEYNALSVLAQDLYQIKTVMKIPKTIFNPKPKVDSSVVQFISKEGLGYTNQKDFFDFVKACFKQRRKTLYNNLKEYYGDANQAEKAIVQANLRLSVRAEELELVSFHHLYDRGGRRNER